MKTVVTRQNIRRAQRGLTLLEMVVVLAILAAVATIAVRSIEGRLDQTHYETTQRQLREIEEAILGPANLRQPDGSLSASGFVSDMGRLPYAIDDDGDNATPLQPQELWVRPNAVAEFQIRQALAPNISHVYRFPSLSKPMPTEPIDASMVQDTNIFVPCGWRGPYLNLSVGETKLRDGWSEPFRLLQADSASLSATNTEVAQFQSLGSDKQLGGTSYDLDLSTVFLATTPVSIDRIHGAIAGTIDTTFVDAANTVSLRLYCPDPATGKIMVFEQTIDPSQGLSFAFPAVTTFNGQTFSMTTGARVLRASQSTPTVINSRVLNIVVPPGGISGVTIRF